VNGFNRRRQRHTNARRRILTMATVDAQQVDETLVFYEDQENLKKLCNFLRSNEGVPVREAIEMDKRVYYLKGQ
jgi:hypothetical protein